MIFAHMAKKKADEGILLTIINLLLATQKDFKC